jgi:hypothetical protein
VSKGYEIEKQTDRRIVPDSLAAPRRCHFEQEYDKQRASGASREVALSLVSNDEVAAFGYPRERLFLNSGSKTFGYPRQAPC